MLSSEVTEELIGKRCSGIFTGMKVTGVITGITDKEYYKAITLKFDSPVRWGDDDFTQTDFWARKIDEFGSLENCKLL